MSAFLLIFLWELIKISPELVKALPELIALIKTLQAAADEAETKRKVADDIKQIHSAFTEQDPEKLRALFNSK